MSGHRHVLWCELLDRWGRFDLGARRRHLASQWHWTNIFKRVHRRVRQRAKSTSTGLRQTVCFGWRFQIRDKAIQTENDYDKDVFNGDVGIVERVDLVEQQVAIRFDDRMVKYDFGELDEVSLAYAVTIHKSQGSEFSAVVIPLATQHYMLLQRT